MATLLYLSPADHGRPLTGEEFFSAQSQEGYHYELIDGRLYVSLFPDLPHNRLEEWLAELLRAYRRQHPEVVNYITSKARIFVPERPELTAPEPDVAAYADFPLNIPMEEWRWEDVSPLLVAEIISDSNPGKDLTRNVELYEQVQSIKEYWILDPRVSASQPSLLVYRRRGRRWQRPHLVAPGETYTTRWLPGFTLLLDPNR